MTRKEIIQTGKAVLKIEAKAVESLAKRLDRKFSDVVDILFRTKSRVIVMGMGKSGLIARKIAATLASCGTPAIFIHPAEAGHGDLGMILKEDVIIAVSYSGDTKEIVDLLDIIKRLGVKLISITGNPDSRIAKYSDFVLDARVAKEADPSGLVPTASSTAALALGDALAIALMNKKCFGEKDFAFVHPKGDVGKRLLKIESLMHKGRGVPCVRASTPMEDVIDEMTRKKFGMTCVLDDDGKLIGIITDGDLRRMLKKHKNKALLKNARNCMTPGPVTIHEEDLATEALNIMERKKITSLIVVDKGKKVKGIVHLHDLWRTEMF